MYSIKVTSVTPLTNLRLLVTFEDGSVRLFDCAPLAAQDEAFEDLRNPDIFALVHVEPGGYGVSWTEDLDASEGELYQDGQLLPLHADDLTRFVQHNIINTAEATEIMGCTRQAIDNLVRRSQLHPVRSFDRSKLFLRYDVAKRRPPASRP